MTKSSKFNWVKVDQTLLMPDIENLVEHFECYELVQALHYQEEWSEFMRDAKVKRAVQEMPDDYLRVTMHSKFDLLVPVEEKNRLKDEFKRALKRGLNSYIDQLMKERGDSVVRKPKYFDELIEDFVADYVAIRSIIRIDAIKNKIPVATIPSTVQSIRDFMKSKEPKLTLPDSLIVKEGRLGGEKQRDAEKASRKRMPLKKEYKRIKRDFELVLKEISELMRIGDENKERLVKLIAERDRLSNILHSRFLMVDFFEEEPSVNKKSNQITFRENWMILISKYLQEKFHLDPDTQVIKQVIGFLFSEIGLGLKSSKPGKSLLEEHGQWTGKRWPK